MSSKTSAGDGSETSAGTAPAYDKQEEKARVSRTSLILWHAHQNNASAVRKVLEEDPSLVHARDYDKRTPLHVVSLHGWIDVVKCLIEFGTDVNAQDRWKNKVRSFLILFGSFISLSCLIWNFCCVCVCVCFESPWLMQKELGSRKWSSYSNLMAVYLMWVFWTSKL